jgi:hypothetical protein
MTRPLYFSSSAIQFLVDDYKADPNTFLYEMGYDTEEKHSRMSTVYIDLGDYLSGKTNESFSRWY